MTNQVIPAEAVDAAARVMLAEQKGWIKWDDLTPFGKQCWLDKAHAALEAAAPILLSHEIEQTRLAHLDAIVNVQTVDALSQEQAAIWESGMRHALAWLGLKQYGDVMAADNPHKEAEPFANPAVPLVPMNVPFGKTAREEA